MTDREPIKTAAPVVAAIAIAAISFATLAPAVALVSCGLGWAMLAIAISDARHFIVPDVLSLPAIPAGLLAALLVGVPSDAPAAPLVQLAAAATGAAALYAIRQLYFHLRGRHGLGLGDVKLAAVAGAWTGFEGLSFVLLIACASAMAWVLVHHVGARRPIDGAAFIPLGAFLAPAIWLTWWLMASGYALATSPI